MFFNLKRKSKKIKRKPRVYAYSFRTNVLDRYFNKDFTLTLPENKKITDVKWFAVYDLASQVNYKF